jgi:hypothetical protein
MSSSHEGNYFDCSSIFISQRLVQEYDTDDDEDDSFNELGSIPVSRCTSEDCENDYFLVKNQLFSQVEMVYKILLAKQYSSLKTEKCDKTAYLFRVGFFSLVLLRIFFIFLGLFLRP